MDWNNVALRPALQRLAKASNSHIYLDRRVDPGTRVNLEAQSEEIQDILVGLTSSSPSSSHWGVSDINDLYYVGPTGAVAELLTLVALRDDELASLPADKRRNFRKVAPTAWPRATFPRGLIDVITRQSGVDVVNLDRIPFDVWPAGEFPPLSLAERLTVLLNGFDLTFRVEPGGTALELIPIHRPVVLRRRYALSGSPLITMEILRQQLPNALLKKQSRAIEIQGSWEEHEKLMDLLSRSTSPQRPRHRKQRTEQMYTLTVREQALQGVIEQLADQLDLEIDMDPAAILAAGIDLEDRTTFSVENVDLERLLRVALPAGLDFELNGRRWLIFPLE